MLMTISLRATLLILVLAGCNVGGKGFGMGHADVIRPRPAVDRIVAGPGCAVRSTCVPSKVCPCNIGTAGCEPGGEACPFPGDGAPCVDESGALPPKASDVAPSILEACEGFFQLDDNVCCSDDQLSSLRDRLAMAEGLLERCPACMSNFRRFWCSFTCSPFQSSFVEVTSSSICDQTLHPGPNKNQGGGCEGAPSSEEQKAAAQSVVVKVDAIYASELFESCKSVTVAATGQRVMDLAFGGAKDAESFLRFIGSAAYRSGQSPLLMDFNFTPGGDGMKLSATDCGTDDEALGCLCGDCAAACPALPDKPSSNVVPSWNLDGLNIDLIAVLVVCFFLASSAFVIPMAMHKDENDLIAALDSMRHFASGQQSNAPDQGRNMNASPDDSEGRGNIWQAAKTLGGLIGASPRFVVVACCTFVLLCGALLVIQPLQLLTDPAQLWAQPGSTSAQDKAFFDSEYGPFWRTEMLIVSNPQEGERTVGYKVLSSLLDLQLEAEGIRVKCSELPAEAGKLPSYCEAGEEWGLDELCFQPVPGGGCLVQSALEFWQMNRSQLDATPGCDDPARSDDCDQALGAYMDVCVEEGTSRRECWARNGMPLTEAGILFGYEGNATVSPSRADAVVVTYLLNNDEWAAPRAAAWERQLRMLVNDDHGPLSGLKVSYSTEDSLTLELAEESASDVGTICVSYIVMFVYVAYALGRHPPSCADPPKARNRAILGLCGVVIVGMSLVVAASVCSLLGVRATLIISEVIPFLILAIGVDNIFILVWAFDGTSTDDSTSQRAAQTLESVGPSIVCAATAESLAFLLGSLSGMPAVVAFSRFAAASVLFGALLQLTLFLALLCIEEENRQYVESSMHERMLGPDKEESSHSLVDAPKKGLAQRVLGISVRAAVSTQGRTAVILVFLALFCSSLYLAATGISLGLEQAEALPTGSYLVNYFDDLARLVRVGPPLFLMVRDANFSNTDLLKGLCTSFGCSRTSLGNTVANAARVPEYTQIVAGATSWVDEYVAWLRSGKGDSSRSCCKMAILEGGADGPVCPVRWTPRLHPGQQVAPECACNATLKWPSPACLNPPCPVPGGCLSPGLPDAAFVKHSNGTTGKPGACWGVSNSGLCPSGGEFPFCDKECYSKYGDYLRTCIPNAPGFPQQSSFRQFFGDFMSSECPSDPSQAAACGSCGAHYAADLGGYARSVLDLRGNAEPVELAHAFSLHGIVSSRHMTYFSPLSTQEDFISAVASAYDLAASVKTGLGGLADVGVYSPFIIFFQQYLTVWKSTAIASAAALAAVFFSTLALLRNFRAAMAVLITAIGVLTFLLGSMAVAGVRLNALSLVNLVASVGISVEFSVHVTHSFLRASGSRGERAVKAVEGVGGVVLSGIVVTKILGVSVLAVAKSRIFVVYYFRMYLALVVAATLHGMVLLPAILSVWGPSSESSKDAPTDHVLPDPEHGSSSEISSRPAMSEH